MSSNTGKKVRVHAIGYGHLDPIWLWDWREGCREDLATFRGALAHIEKYPGFKMTISSAGQYMWIKRYDPDLFARVVKMVQEGRLEVVGGWWIEPDVNLPGGEALLRQGIYGKRFFKEFLGVDSIIGFNPDTFGHPITLPKILKHLGQFYYVFMRPEAKEKNLPNDVFIWESEDGSQVIASRILEGYGCDDHCDQKVDKLIELIKNKEIVNDVLCFYGTGDHGGGPTQKLIESFQALQIDDAERTVKYSTIHDYCMYLEPFRNQLPVVKDELQHHARGCYSVHNDIKQLNRRCENQLITAEKWATVASLLFKREFPRTALEHGWENVLLHQFHDVITGTSIRRGLDDTKMYLNETLAICDRELFGAVRALASQVQINNPNGEFIVFNPHPWTVDGPIQIEYSFDPRKSLEFVDSEGKVLPFQDIQRSELTSAGRKHWVFSDALPPMGYKTYHWREKETADVPAPGELGIGATWLENQFWRLEFDPQTGQLTRLFDRKNGVEIINQPAAALRVIKDTSDTWSHDLARYTGETGEFGNAEFRIYEPGPVRVGLYIRTQWNRSVLQQKWLIYQNDPRIEIDFNLNWQEQHQIAKYCFPFNFKNAACHSEQPYGQISRPANGEEHPFQQWLDVVGEIKNGAEMTEYGIAVLNNGINAYSLHENELELSICRSAIYAHHDPTVPKPEVVYDYSDQGRHELKFWLLPHPGKTTPPQITRRAQELNAPGYVLIDYPHEGYLPQVCSFLEIAAENVVGTVFKTSENGNGFMVRCLETAGINTTTEIRLPYLKMKAEITVKPFSLNTFHLTIKGGKIKINESNAIEE
jgi:alpha-mannosidase